LLTDLRRVLEGRSDERWTSAELVQHLRALEDRQWDETFDARILTRLFAPYDVRPKIMRFGDAIVRGYERAELIDAFGRYLAP